MKDRIGEFLVKEGKITEKQLATALERQLVMGGRLGTNLIELGLISEDELVGLLSQQFDVPPISIQDLEDINPELIKLISRDLAQKYSVVPFKRDRKTLSVICLNPQNLEAISELGFITGCVIKPHVGSEARLLKAMEHYYQISRPLRYISLLDDERKILRAEEEETPKQKDPTAQELMDAINNAKEEWGMTTHRDEAITTFLNTTHMVFDHGILFLVKAGKLFGWRSYPLNREVEVKKLQFNLAEMGPFHEAVTSKSDYKGDPPSTPAYRDVETSLDAKTPKQVMLTPLVIKGTVVALFYGGNLESELSPHGTEFVSAASKKLSLALEILILKNKILEV